MSAPDPDAPSLILGQLADQTVALERRINTVNRPGNLDGLFAFHVLRDAAMSSFTWQVNPLAGSWLDGHVDRLRNAPQLAVLGYTLTHFAASKTSAIQYLITGMRELIRRDPFPADGVSFVHDPRQLLGITLAVRIVSDELPQAHDWLLSVVEDSRFRTDDVRTETLQRQTRAMLTDAATVLTDASAIYDIAQLAWVHWVCTLGTVRLADPVTELPMIQQRILNRLLRTDIAELSVSDTALIRAATGRIIEASIDAAVLSRSHVGVILRRFSPAMQRWRWDKPNEVKNPIRWQITSEREVQDIVWMLLRAVFDDVVYEEPLPRLGHSSYRADFGLPRLGVLIEVKYVRSAGEFKKVEKEVIEDSVAYLRDRTTYTTIVVFIYDESQSTQEHDATASALRSLNHVIDVVIVSRPSHIGRLDNDRKETTDSSDRRRRGR